MSARHTSGPWQSRDDYTTDGFVTIIGNIDGEYVDGKPECTYDVICVCEDEYGERLPNVAANVRLITAAPDTVKALQSTLGHLLNAVIDLQSGCPKKTAIATLNGGIAIARAAIAKALGEQA